MTKQTADPTIETRRKALMQARTVAIANRDWPAMNEITKRLAKLPVKVLTAPVSPMPRGSTEPTMRNFLLRKAPEPLWRAVKAKAATEGKSIRTVIIELLQKYAKA